MDPVNSLVQKKCFNIRFLWKLQIHPTCNFENQHIPLVNVIYSGDLYLPTTKLLLLIETSNIVFHQQRSI